MIFNILIRYVCALISITLLNALETTSSFDRIDGPGLTDCGRLWHVMVHAWAVLAKEI